MKNEGQQSTVKTERTKLFARGTAKCSVRVLDSTARSEYTRRATPWAVATASDSTTVSYATNDGGWRV